MYKVLKEIEESVSSGTKGQSSLALGGRVRSPEMKALLAKQLGMGLQGLENAAGSMMDLKTGRIQPKKIKKEKTPEQLCIDEMKKLLAKFLACTLSLLACPIMVQPQDNFHLALCITICLSEVEEAYQRDPEVYH